VDILDEDLLGYTNAGKNLGHAIFLCDWAASVGALKLLVAKNPYFVREVRTHL
jgi:hypothetical protein